MADLFIQPDPAIERRRRLAEALGAGPKFQNVQHWTQGASNIAGPMLSAWLGRSADQDDAQRRQEAMEKITVAMNQGGGEAGQGDRYGALVEAISGVNPELGLNMKMQQMQRQQAMQQAAAAAEAQRTSKLQDAKDLAKFKSELPRKESQFDQYLKTLQAEKMKADAAKKQQDVDAGMKALQAEQYNVQTAADLAQRLSGHSGFERIYGAFQGATPSIGQDAVDAEGIRDQLLDILTLAARGQLKGQGQITEGETGMLARAQTMLKNPRISDEAAAQEVQRVLEYLGSKGAQLPSNDQPAGGGGGQMGRNRGGVSQAPADMARPTTDEEYNALPSGSMYIDPDDGKTYRKP